MKFVIFYLLLYDKRKLIALNIQIYCYFYYYLQSLNSKFEVLYGFYFATGDTII